MDLGTSHVSHSDAVQDGRMVGPEIRGDVESLVLPQDANQFHRILRTAFLDPGWKSFTFHVAPRFNPAEFGIDTKNLSPAPYIEQARQAYLFFLAYIEHHPMPIAEKNLRIQWIHNAAINLSSQIMDLFTVQDTMVSTRVELDAVTSPADYRPGDDG